MCLSLATLILFNKQALKKFGGDDLGVLKYDEIESLAEFVEMTCDLYGFDDIERDCLVVYQIVKKHFFGDGNKRTANYVLINCLREKGLAYVGRPKDLADKIIELASSDPNAKREAILQLSYFLKSHLQKR